MSDHLDTLAHYAMRYAMGRMSTAPEDTAEAIRAVWADLSPETRALMIRDVEKAIAKDGFCRERGLRYRPLGDDRDTWVSLLGWMRDPEPDFLDEMITDGGPVLAAMVNAALERRCASSKPEDCPALPTGYTRAAAPGWNIAVVDRHGVVTGYDPGTGLARTYDPAHPQRAYPVPVAVVMALHAIVRGER